MSGRIEIYDSRKEQTSKWSQNEAFSVREAGVDIGKDGGGQGGSDVSVDQVVTSGREVAGITVDGERTAILIPNAGEWTQSDWDETDPSDDAYIKNKPSLAQVATSGSYADLSNTPDLSNFVEDANYVHTDYNYDLGAKNIVDHVTDNLAGKVDKVSGKVLSDNNFTNAQKDKLTNLANIYGVGANLTLDPETNILSANAQPITIDDEMSSSSTNAVQNRVITGALANKVDKVTGKVLSDNNYTTAEKDKLAGIDQGAEVNDISTISVNGVNVPADANKNVNLQISSSEVNDGILTITQDGTTLGSFTANQSSNSTIDIPAGGGCHVIENTSGTQMTSRSNLQFTGGSEVSDDSENDRTVVRVAEGVETSSYAYSQLSQAEKNDPLKIYFLNDSVPHDVDTPIDVSDFSHKKENNMTISVFAKQLIYKYDGFGGGIGASSYDPIAIPAEATKIKFKFTTGNSYSTTNVKHKITIGVKAAYQQTQFVFPDDTDWLVQKTYNTRYDTVEDYIDISSVTTPCYLMMCGHGWNVTFENFWETELESGGNTKIMYENVPYGDTNAGEWTQSDWAETDPSDDAYIKNKPSLATVATSGSYEDLSDQPDLSIYISDPNYTHTDNNYTTAEKTKLASLSTYSAGDGIDISNGVISTDNLQSGDMSDIVSPLPGVVSRRADVGFTPVGTIIAVMGVNAPANYLACNGQVVNIADYPELSDYFYQQFGSKNKFGGNGTTTFGIPDLRGEFLRGTGTNGHTGQGDGGSVGVHQDGTEFPFVFGNTSNAKLTIRGYTDSYNNIIQSDADKTVLKSDFKAVISSAGTTETASVNATKGYTSRPTNTSVLYCIATKNIYLNPSLDYSTTEKIVGTWIDGKPLYQKTFTGLVVPNTTDGTEASSDIDISDLNIDTIVSMQGIMWNLPANNKKHCLALPAILASNKELCSVISATVNNAPKLRIVNTASAFNGRGINATIQYTKTTN